MLSFQQVVRDKRTGKTKGYGFVSFANPSDLAAALKEMNGEYFHNRQPNLDNLFLGIHGVDICLVYT